MTDEIIKKTALTQSAIDLGCEPGDFLASDGRVVISKSDSRARRYLKLPFVFQLVSYGSNAVVSCREELVGFAKGFIAREDFYHCFETPAMYELNSALEECGARVKFMADYYLPSVKLVEDAVKSNRCGFTLRVLTAKDFGKLYLPEWSHALCADRRELDVLGVGAYEMTSVGEKLIGLAGCSADCEDMWQIGVDVLRDYRCHGIAKAMVSRLAAEVMERGKVPFYCAAWSNIRSRRCAMSSGFRPGWVELTAAAACRRRVAADKVKV